MMQSVKWITAAGLAAATGLPEWVVADKLGIVERVVAGPGRRAPPDITWIIRHCIRASTHVGGVAGGGVDPATAI